MQRKLENAGDPLSKDFPTGPDVGQKEPDFTLPDPSGNLVNFTRARGAKRALILFYRSASW